MTIRIRMVWLRLRASWALIQLAAILPFDPEYVDRAVITAGALRAQTPSGRKAMERVVNG